MHKPNPFHMAFCPLFSVTEIAWVVLSTVVVLHVAPLSVEYEMFCIWAWVTAEPIVSVMVFPSSRLSIVKYCSSKGVW